MMASTLIHQRPMGLDAAPNHTPPTTRPPLQYTPPSDERPCLPALGLNISRPSSRLSTTSSRSLSSGYYDLATRQNVQLPGLSALASIAAGTPPPETITMSRSQTPQMNFYSYTPTPTATPGGGSTPAPPCCQNCSTSTTPLWRRDENGSVLCNACGLFLKLHGRPRPISLKTDVIKSRNRVKAQTGKGSKAEPPQHHGGQHISLAASHPGLARLDPDNRHAIHPAHLDRTNSPISRTGTPGLGPVHIAPQHLFDQVVHRNGSEGYGPSPPIAQFGFRANSPGAASTSSFTANSAVNGSHAPVGTAMDMAQDITTLKTRVSELEVINDLFRGSVTELQAQVVEKGTLVEAERQEKARLRAELDQARQRIEELEAAVGGRRSKRSRMDEYAREDNARAADA